MARHRLFALAVAVAAAAPAPAQVTAVTDGTFTDTDWSLTVFNNSGGLVTAGQVTTGGNPGAYRANSWTAGVTFSGADAVSFRNGFTYTPATQGPIASWTFRADEELVSGAVGVDGGVFLAVRQNGTVYRAIIGTNALPGTWLTDPAPAPDPANFIRVSGAGPANPDFVAGGAIDFGYDATFTTSVGASGSATVGVDNFTVSVAPVPEPSALALAGLAAAGLAYRRPRRRWLA